MYLVLLTIYTEDNCCISAPCVYIQSTSSFYRVYFLSRVLGRSVALTEDQTLLRQPHSSSPCITNYWPCLTNSRTSTGTCWDQMAHSYMNFSTTNLNLLHNSKRPTTTYRPE